MTVSSKESGLAVRDIEHIRPRGVCDNQSGNVAIMFSLMFIPLVTAIGLATVVPAPAIWWPARLCCDACASIIVCRCTHTAAPASVVGDIKVSKILGECSVSREGPSALRRRMSNHRFEHPHQAAFPQLC